MDLPKALLEGALEGLPAQFAILDAAGTIVYTNERWRSFGVANDIDEDPTSIGKNYIAVCDAGGDDDEFAASTAAGLRSLLAGDREEFSLEYPCHSQSEKRWFLLYARAYEFEGGQDAQGDRYALVEHLDVTDRKLTELELSESNAHLKTVAGVLSHDLRNPISVAVGYLDELEDRRASPSTFVSGLRSCLERMQRIIDDALLLAREAGIDELEPVHLDVSAMKAWRYVEVDDATLEVDDSMQFMADPSLLDSLFENLFRNSVEHGTTNSRARSGDAVEHGSQSAMAATGCGCESSETVTIRVGVLPDGIGFYVEDDGPGIPEAQREEVFETGFTTGGSDNTGLGLTIVSNVADAHGWTVDVADASPGARFEFRGVGAAG
ncbi:PAS domain-containing sensor histidine kinase [Haloarchaeobius sp. HME9146]|uniref:PAS domain-containing sensor histidine kinase n=1 Tax=Haloarchaeobius sp. HME9146 TaxID=2978732 RepID=UPI0021BE133A|nr:PAS domain-containing sensor histidine kinase [Haloarchaeobius sp. HME9146]MCT9098408.1 PAS domain-containing sensor histidine kinase [Haloarchaeobius sp. HME9146]